MKVWILEYDHKHDTEISIYDDEASAVARAQRITKARARRAVDPEKLEAALEENAWKNWWELTGANETFRITETPVLDGGGDEYEPPAFELRVTDGEGKLDRVTAALRALVEGVEEFCRSETDPYELICHPCDDARALLDRKSKIGGGS